MCIYADSNLAMYNTLWFSGAIISAGSARGGLNTGGDYSWRLITWLQALFSGLIVIFSMLIPESPRWLYVNGKKDQAKEVLTKYHGNGNPDSPWVALQLHEYEELLNEDGADKRWWDYRALFRDRASFYRLGCNIVMSIFGQWAGNAVLSYFLGSVLDTAGYTGEIEQANITLINNCQQFAWAILGATLVDKLGRRPLLLFSFTACTVVWLGMTIASNQFEQSYVGDDKDGDPIYSNSAASKASLSMIFIFGAVYSFGITPLQALYPVEVLSFEMRAKGMAFSNLAVNAAGLLNQFAWPVSMEKIGWKTYIIFTVWDAIQVIVVFFFLPETKGRTVSLPRPDAHICTSKSNIFRNSSRNSMRSSTPRTLSRPRRRRSSSPSPSLATWWTSRASRGSIGVCCVEYGETVGLAGVCFFYVAVAVLSRISYPLQRWLLL
jgi:MFS family permease